MKKINLLDYEKELSKVLETARQIRNRKKVSIAESTGLARPTCDSAFNGRIRNLNTLVKILYDLNIELYLRIRE